MKWPALAVILAASLAARVAGISFGLPDVFHQDEPIVLNHALGYVGGDLNPHFFKIPPLASYVLFALYGAWFVFLKVFRGVTQDAFARSFFEDPTPFYLIGRAALGAAAGTATVAALYAAVRRWAGVSAALLAALFLGFAYLHVRDSHYIYADVPMILFVVISAAFLSRHSSGGKVSSLAWAGAAAGAAVAFKYTAAPMALAVAWAALSRPEPRTARVKALFTAGAVSAATYAALNPFSILDTGFFLEEIRTQAAAEGAFGPAHHWTYSLYEGFGEPASVLGVLGLAWIAWKRPPERWFVVFPAAYFVFIALFSQAYERYAMPLVPFLAAGAGVAVIEISRLYKTPVARAVVGTALAAGCVYPNVLKTVHLDHLLAARLDTRTLALRWFDESVPPGAVVALDHPFFSPRLPQTPDQILSKRVGGEDPHAELKSEKIRYAAEAAALKKTYRVHFLEDPGGGSARFLMLSPVLPREAKAIRAAGIEYYVRWRHPRDDGFFGRELAKDAELVAVFSPYANPEKRLTEDEWANVALPFRSRELFSRERMGPYLEVYRLKS